MDRKATHTYGSSTDIFINRKRSGDSVVIGGLGADEARWTRVLSHRAAQMLWYHLTGYLFPEKSDMVTAMVSTAPLRDDSKPTITTHMTVEALENGCFDILGWVGEQTWWIQLNAREAHRLWTALDIALYPVGWKGSKH
jgi:hypothetical protein